jgi:hypothetical protein
MNDEKIIRMQIGTHLAQVHEATADACPNAVGGITLTFQARDHDKRKRVRVWVGAERIADLFRQMFGRMSPDLAVKHPDILKLARMTALLADEIEQARERDDEPGEPEEGDYTTEDHRRFYQYGKLVVEVDDGEEWAHAVKAHMDEEQFWPDVWFISDHGNAHIIEMFDALAEADERAGTGEGDDE